jgi:hypothetical protein
MISWEISELDHDLAIAIAQRADDRGFYRDFPHPFRIAFMDIIACHANGNPLDLAQLLMINDYEFMHDVCGIRDHIDRDTGQLRDCFVPRTTRRAAVVS